MLISSPAAFSLSRTAHILILLHHRSCFFSQMVPQCIGFQHPYMTPPTQQPWYNLARLANHQCHQQTIFSLLFGGHEILASLPYPTSYFPVEQHSHKHSSGLLSVTLMQLKMGRTRERAGQQFQLLHTIETKIAQILTKMT